jgi:hypothetical protein
VGLLVMLLNMLGTKEAGTALGGCWKHIVVVRCPQDGGGNV